MREPPVPEQLCQASRRHGRSFRAKSPVVPAVCFFFLLVLVLVLSVRVRSMVGPLGVDEWIDQHLVRRLPPGDGHAAGAYGWIARIGAPSFVGVITTLALAWALRRRDVPGGLFAVISPGLAFVLAEMVIKPVVARRMHAEDLIFVFPSGTVTVVAASVAAFVVLVHRWAGRTRAALVAVVLSVVPLTVCVAVIEVGWHYATDVIGGMAVGGAVVLAVAGLLAAFERRVSVNGLTTAHARP